MKIESPKPFPNIQLPPVVKHKAEKGILDVDSMEKILANLYRKTDLYRGNFLDVRG